MSIADKLTTIAANEQKVYNAGQKSERNRFWDMYQQNGNRKDYLKAFMFWSDDCYDPKYPIVCEGASTGPEATSLFLNATITDTKVPISVIGTRMDTMFQECRNLKTIRSLRLEDVSRANSTFYHCYALEDITIEGEIPVSLNFNHSTKLTDASVQSIIDHLADLTGKTAQTLTFYAAVGGKLTDAQKAACTAKNWTLVY